MKIKSIKVDNFKSLVGFELPLADFSCLIGLNSSGKSTILQFFDFLSQQVRGDLSGWLKKRQWEASDLNSKLTRKQNIDFEVLLSHTDYGEFEIKWSASFNRKTLHCTFERIEWNNQLLLKVDNGNYQAWTLQKGEEIVFPYIGEAKRADIQAKLAKVYPQFRHLDILSLRSGWKSLTVQEQFGDTIVKTEARHVADGFLRMLAVFAQLSKEQSFLLLDEIENGVNPELQQFAINPATARII
jgi:predicted ATPase